MDQPQPPSVARLLAAIQKNGHFPATARTVGLIATPTSSGGTSPAALADTILQDHGLKQELLGLVNTMTCARSFEDVT